MTPFQPNGAETLPELDKPRTGFRGRKFDHDCGTASFMTSHGALRHRSWSRASTTAANGNSVIHCGPWRVQFRTIELGIRVLGQCLLGYLTYPSPNHRFQDSETFIDVSPEHSHMENRKSPSHPEESIIMTLGIIEQLQNNTRCLFPERVRTSRGNFL